jgi:transferase CAF17, mitochondrial
MTASSATAAAIGRFGRLWGRGHEKLVDRRILSVSGTGATTYLQNLVTSHLLAPPRSPQPEPLHTTLPGVPQRLQASSLINDTNRSSSSSSSSSSSRMEENTSELEASSVAAAPMIQFNEQLRSTCFLDPKGRVITDSLLWKLHSEHYFLDVPGSAADALLSHLRLYQLRKSKVTVTDCTASGAHSYVVFGTLASAGTPPGYLAGLDPRHPSLGLRVLQLPSTTDDTRTGSASGPVMGQDTNNETMPSFTELIAQQFPEMPGNYDLVRRLAGVAEGAELTGRIALETNQELLNAVAFDKGCYLGQELTARVFHTGVVRKRILPLLIQDAYTQVPHPWVVASSLQSDRHKRTFTRDELSALPSRLPRLSVATAGNLVAVTTGSVAPNPNAVVSADAAAELAAAQAKTAAWMEALHGACHAGVKLVDTVTGETVGQVVAPPLPGTNVILALMRLETVGLLAGGVWSKTNKITMGEHEFRYLPYLPLWWPELSLSTGKAKTESDDDALLEARVDDSSNNNNNNNNSTRSKVTPPGMTRVEMEEIPEPSHQPRSQ